MYIHGRLTLVDPSLWSSIALNYVNIWSITVVFNYFNSRILVKSRRFNDAVSLFAYFNRYISDLLGVDGSCWIITYSKTCERSKRRNGLDTDLWRHGSIYKSRASACRVLYAVRRMPLVQFSAVCCMHDLFGSVCASHDSFGLIVGYVYIRMQSSSIFFCHFVRFISRYVVMRRGPIPTGKCTHFIPCNISDF